MAIGVLRAVLVRNSPTPTGVPTNPGIKAAGFRARRFSYSRVDPSTLSDLMSASNTLFLADLSITIEYTEAFSSDDFRL